MDSLERDAFEATIRSVVQQRSIRYTSAQSLSIRWKNDDTAAANDTAHFQTLLQTLRLPAAQELVISSTSGWAVRGEFQKMLFAAKNTTERALAIVHYAGHGIKDSDGSLLFVEFLNSGSKGFNADRYLISLVTTEGDMMPSNVDVLFIFDCCYGLTACRAAETSPRIVEIIAATDPSSPLALSPSRNTITAKLLGEIRRRQRDGYSYIEVANIIGSLRTCETAIKRPTHCLKLGTVSICLPVVGLPTVDPTDTVPALKALFSVHISYDMSQEERDQFVDWLKIFRPVCP